MGNKAKYEKLKRAFITKFGEEFIAGTVSEFYGHEENYSGLWVSGENSDFKINGHTAVDYYGYEMVGGVHPDFDKWVSENAAYFEFNDPGTLMIYLN